jgi:3-hydroxy-9,10-secoandrosta-1,3,5(10)-triene-9,17-dione monooxygenase
MTHAEAIELARSFAPVIRERAVQAEQKRRQPMETIQELTSAGLARLLTPRAWGGYELGFDAFADAVIEIGKADASAGWCFSFLNVHAWFLAHYPEQAQRDVWSVSPDVALADSFIPAGRVTRVEGGFRVSGTWPFVSGIDHSTWAMLAGFIPGEQAPGPHVFLMPESDYEIEDTWFVAGLKGSGSKSVVVKDVFVPLHRAVNLIELSDGISPGATLNPHPMYRHAALAIFPCALVSPIVGATIGAYDLMRENLRTKSTRITGTALSTYSHQQIRLTENSIDISNAQHLLREVLAIACSEGPITLEQRMLCHRNFAAIAKLCVSVVERIYLSSGGSANYESHPLQRYWRDIHAMASHSALGFDMAGETYGLHEIGQPRNPRDPYL